MRPSIIRPSSQYLNHRFEKSLVSFKVGRALEFEASPFSRIVREVLCSLEIPYLLHNVARGSPRREAFEQRSGRIMVPWLVDPNTGTEMFESADIARYLDETYAA